MDAFLARAAAVQLVQSALLSSDRVKQFIRDLPILEKDEVPPEDNCPICLLPFLEIFQGEEGSTKTETEGEDDGKGVTKLSGCGHIFCRSDLVEWIRANHLSCPTCRFQFIQVNTHSQAIYGEDDGSSDGGEYYPSSEGEEDIDVDASELTYFPPEIRYDVYRPDWEDEVESIPIDSAMDEREAMMEDEAAWIDDYDPEYGDAGLEDGPGDMNLESEPVGDGPLDPGFDDVADDVGLWDPPEINLAEDDGLWYPPRIDPADENGPLDLPEIDPAEVPRPSDPSEIDPTEEDGRWDLSGLGSADTGGADEVHLHHGLTMEEAFGEVADGPGVTLECSECESDSDLAGETGIEPDYMDEALGVRGANAVDAVTECIISVSEQEELEVELGLTDGESDASTFTEDEVREPALPVDPASIQVSVDGDSTDEAIISYIYEPQSLK